MATMQHADFHTALGNIRTILEAYATAQKAVDATWDFTVLPFPLTALPKDDGAYMYLYLSSIPRGARGGTWGPYQYNAEYSIDLYVRSKGLRDGDEYTKALEREAERLDYLVRQAGDALYNAESIKLGFTEKEISKRPFFSYTALPPERQMLFERPVMAGVMTFELGLAWTPALLDGHAIYEINIDMPLADVVVEP